MLMSEKTTLKILVAEDDDALRELIRDILEIEGYQVVIAENGLHALEILQKQVFNLLISDIQMPGMDGFALFEKCAKLYPEMQRILITAYDVDSYMDLITTHNVGNILIKNVPFDTSDLVLLVSQLLSRDIFGLHRHLGPETQVYRALIRQPSEIEEFSQSMAQIYGAEHNFRKLRTVLIELLTNAVFYGARNEQGDDKSLWNTNFVLSDGDAIEIEYGQDGEKIGFGIVDKGGRLDKRTILYWLNRQITPGEGGLPTGVYDSHGRGLYITRKFVDRLLIHVDPGKRCECIILNYTRIPGTPIKPLRIIEL